jgi:hypothetical protein
LCLGHDVPRRRCLADLLVLKEFAVARRFAREKMNLHKKKGCRQPFFYVQKIIFGISS